MKYSPRTGGRRAAPARSWAVAVVALLIFEVCFCPAAMHRLVVLWELQRGLDMGSPEVTLNLRVVPIGTAGPSVPCDLVQTTPGGLHVLDWSAEDSQAFPREPTWTGSAQHVAGRANSLSLCISL